ncbi:PREDICTED: DNA polymerase delta subunit 3 [Lupinus angustifolius]|uniref:DNA polymerase delta subunit 3 n=1 Tax=Lupinus angustifolius TaxID=3871 RepID=UPI00092EEF97|nr:PREDICTED: DNA polymerase delta subunit 3 [Lupinus angustifolius]
MAKTLTLIHEIESLVSDNLQVVSYKWLSRNYMISSNEAKRLLQEFVEKRDVGLEVVYALSGWLKSSQPSYHVKLVTAPKLADAQQEFDGNCSVHVYSVQASIPKDPAMLWNAEFIQAEELSKQPFSVDNCLRDNRFCGISSSFVSRTVDGQTVVSAAPHTKPAVSMESTKNNIVYQPPKNISHDSIPEVLKPQNVMKDVKSESDSTGTAGVHNDINKPTEDKEKVLPLPTGKRKAQADKSSSVTGSSLASLWGRASAKPKPCSPPAENNNTASKPTVATDGAQTRACEAGEDDSGDDDNHIDVSVKRSTNRRRVIFDFSDEDEDAVNLASPEPIKQSPLDSRQNDKKSSEKATLKFDKQIESKSRVKEETESDQKANQPRREDLSVISKCTSTGKSSTEKVESRAPEILVNKDSQNNAAPCSPKRRRVMKTKIDERGREVTEVVWEGEETEAKKTDKATTKKSDNNTTNAVNSAPASKKSANTISNPTGKGGNKKAGKTKDPKQGNILSFFKKV